MKYFKIALLVLVIYCSFNTGFLKKSKVEQLNEFFEMNPGFISDGFDFPVGKPNASGYVNAQEFQSRRGHLGEDWNNASKEDMGDPVYAAYSPHLHFELREDINISVGHGYGDPKGYLNPTRFIKSNRKLRGKYYSAA